MWNLPDRDSRSVAANLGAVWGLEAPPLATAASYRLLASSAMAPEMSLALTSAPCNDSGNFSPDK